MSPPWFHAPQLAASLTAGEVLLDGPEARHLLQVLRLDTGEPVTLFNGAGLRADGIIGSTTRKTAHITLGQVTHSPPATLALSLAVALPKGDRVDWLIEKCTELGVVELIPLRTTRSVVDAGAGKLERLRQHVFTACKQCRRDHAMVISETVSFSELLGVRAAQGSPTNHHTWLLDPSGTAQPVAPTSPATTALALVGPEGGFTPDELEQAGSGGVQVVRLPTPILRIETAAVALAAWWALSGSRE